MKKNALAPVTRDILKLIRDFHSIVICRHVNPDGDAEGAAFGLRRILQLTYPEKDVRVVNRGGIPESIAFLGQEDTADVSFYRDALVIVLDCAVLNRLDNENVMSGACVVKIDHHPDVEPFGDHAWVEPTRSSTSEMIADLWWNNRDVLRMDTEAARALYVGIVTDTGRFMFSTSGNTMRLAATLLEYGFDCPAVFANLYLESFEYRQFSAAMTAQINRTPAGVAWLHVTKELQERYALSHEQSGNTVLLMNDIAGSPIRIVFIDNEDGSIRVRIRSRFIVINQMAIKYHGGGHAFASGATVYSPAEMQALLDEADILQRDWLREHPDVR